MSGAMTMGTVDKILPSKRKEIEVSTFPRKPYNVQISKIHASMRSL